MIAHGSYIRGSRQRRGGLLLERGPERGDGLAVGVGRLRTFRASAAKIPNYENRVAHLWGVRWNKEAGEVRQGEGSVYRRNTEALWWFLDMFSEGHIVSLALNHWSARHRFGTMGSFLRNSLEQIHDVQQHFPFSTW